MYSSIYSPHTLSSPSISSSSSCPLSPSPPSLNIDSSSFPGFTFSSTTSPCLDAPSAPAPCPSDSHSSASTVPLPYAYAFPEQFISLLRSKIRFASRRYVMRAALFQLQETQRFNAGFITKSQARALAQHLQRNGHRSSSFWSRFTAWLMPSITLHANHDDRNNDTDSSEEEEAEDSEYDNSDQEKEEEEEQDDDEEEDMTDFEPWQGIPRRAMRSSWHYDYLIESQLSLLLRGQSRWVEQNNIGPFSPPHVMNAQQNHISSSSHSNLSNSSSSNSSSTHSLPSSSSISPSPSHTPLSSLSPGLYTWRELNQLWFAIAKYSDERSLLSFRQLVFQAFIFLFSFLLPGSWNGRMKALLSYTFLLLSVHEAFLWFYQDSSPSPSFLPLTGDLDQSFSLVSYLYLVFMEEGFSPSSSSISSLFAGGIQRYRDVCFSECWSISLFILSCLYFPFFDSNSFKHLNLPAFQTKRRSSRHND